MENEPEMIRQQMMDTRTALSNKIEMLEQQIVSTVQAANAAVTETVNSVKGIVQETAQTVGNSLQKSVEAVKDTFDLTRHVTKRPWTMMAGAAALGYLSGVLMRGSRSRQANDTGRRARNVVANGTRAIMVRNGVPEIRHARTTIQGMEMVSPRLRPLRNQVGLPIWATRLNRKSPS